MDLDAAGTGFREFVSVIKALRTPGTGCPWDLEQTHQTLRPYLIEEAHEVLEAIDRSDDRALQEELGDLLLQIVLHAQLADDRQAFSIVEVIDAIREKMVRRHPHVFGSVEADSPEEVHRNWEQIKREEKQQQGAATHPRAVLDSVPGSLPALHRAQSVAGKAARLGLQQENAVAPFTAARQALARLEQTKSEGEDAQQQLGLLLFAVCRIARKLDVSAEDSLRDWLRGFIARQESR